jgi:hypothetical protein
MVNLPAKASDILRLDRLTGERLAKSFKEIYNEFNGFRGGLFDEDSYIRVWEIEKIIKRYERDRGFRLVFADVAMNAHILYMDLAQVGGPICELSGDQISTSFSDFWDDMLNGRLDF